MYSRVRNTLIHGAVCALFALTTSAFAQDGTLYLDMTNMRSGEEVSYRTIDLDADTLVERDSFVLLTVTDSLVAVGSIVDSTDYRVDFYSDKNGNGVYDGKTVDRSWQVEIVETTGDDTITFVYTPVYVALLWPDEVEPNDVKADADSIDLGTAYLGYIQTVGDTDRYIVEAPAYAGSLSVTVTVPAGSGLSCYVAIKDSSDSSTLASSSMEGETLTVTYA